MPPPPPHRPRPGSAELRRLSPQQWECALASDPAEAARWLDAAAHFGLVEAQTFLGQILLDGRGVTSDPAAGFAWFCIAAAAGHPPAMNMAGRCLERGWGTAVDQTQAAHWYRQAAGQGLDWAQYNLANALLRGRGVALDRRAAWHWFLKAARQGHAKSMNLIGRFLEEGWDRPADFQAALCCYHAAADAGDYRAHYNLGTLAWRRGQKAEAIDRFDRAMRDASPDLLQIIAHGLGRSGDPELVRIAHTATRMLGLAEAQMPEV